MCFTPTQYSFSSDGQKCKFLAETENSAHTGLKTKTENPNWELAFVLNDLQNRDGVVSLTLL